MGKLIAAALLVAACGKVNTVAPDGHGVDGAAAITRIDVTATITSLTWPATEALKATAVYSDQSMVDVTTTATWSSDTMTVATVDAMGTLTTLDKGSAVIHAKVGEADGSTTISVIVPTLAVSGYAGAGVDFFPANANGNVAPTRSIRGAATTFTSPRGLLVVGTELFVADQGKSAIDVFDLTASGNIAPKRQIIGAATTLVSPSQMIVVNNELYVADQSSGVKVFPATGNGNIAPSRTIAIANTTTSVGVAATTTELYIGSYGSAVISVVPLTANGTVTPTRTITGLSEPQGLLIHDNELLVSNAGTVSLNVYPLTSNGAAAPTRQIIGSATMLSYPDELALIGNRVFSANYSNSTVDTFDLTATGNVTPLTSLGGTNTLINSDLGLAIY